MIFGLTGRLNGDDPVSTLTQDFHTRLDNLLRTLVHAKPHFIRCVRANNVESPGHFDRSVVSRQVRALQVLETVNLMAGGKKRMERTMPLFHWIIYYYFKTPFSWRLVWVVWRQK